MYPIQSPDVLLPKLIQYLQEIWSEKTILVGIEKGGLHALNCLKDFFPSNAFYHLNINFYRDDFAQVGLHPSVGPSSLPASIEDLQVILIDDVLYTGRTVRCAMNELFDFGRPACIKLCVLYDRSGRQLPIQANWVGQEVVLETHQNIQVSLKQPTGIHVEIL